MYFILWLFLYRLLWLVLLPIIVARLLIKSINEYHYRKRFIERLGYLSQCIKKQRNFKKNLIWIHCVSIGEFLASKPLIKRILSNHGYQLLITSTTPSGSLQIINT